MRYIKLNEVTNMIFYQVPKVLFTSKYKLLSNNARMTYAILRDRMDLSIKNKWQDEQGNVYVIFSRENLSQELGVNEKSITKYLKELKDVQLIDEKRRGINKPNLIYVCMPEDIENTRNGNFYGSRPDNFTGQDLTKCRPNDTNIIYTDLNETDFKNIKGTSTKVSFDVFLKNISEDYLLESKIHLEVIKYYCDGYEFNFQQTLKYTFNEWTKYTDGIFECSDYIGQPAIETIKAAIDLHFDYSYNFEKMYLLHNFKDEVKDNRIFETGMK